MLVFGFVSFSAMVWLGSYGTVLKEAGLNSGL